MRIARSWMGAVLVSLAVGCGGDDDDGGDGGSGDGGARPDAGRFDASSPDGGDSDGALADASLPDASTGPGLVTVTVEWGNLPVEGHTVFFLRSDDSVIDIVQTDQDGRASAMFDQPGTVVVQIDEGTPPWLHRLNAYLGVPPGTDIHSGIGITSQSGSLTVSGPAPAQPLEYAAETPCGVNYGGPEAPSVTVSLTNCASRTAVVWVAPGMVDGEPRTFSAFAPDAPVEPDGTLAVKGPLREDVLQTTRVTGLPQAEIVSSVYRIQSGHGTLQEGTFRDSPIAVGGTLEFVDSFHDLRDRGLIGVAVVPTYRDVFNSTTYLAWLDHDGAPDVDVSVLSPPVRGVAWVHRSDGTWTWTEESPGDVAGIRGTIVINLPDFELILWRVLAPNDGTAVRIPRLPAPYDRLLLEPTSPTSSALVEHIGHTRGYRALLEDIEGALYYRGQPGDLVVDTFGATLTD